MTVKFYKKGEAVMKYSTGFRNTVMKKVLPPESKSISEVGDIGTEH